MSAVGHSSVGFGLAVGVGRWMSEGFRNEAYTSSSLYGAGDGGGAKAKGVGKCTDGVDTGCGRLVAESGDGDERREISVGVHFNSRNGASEILLRRIPFMAQGFQTGGTQGRRQQKTHAQLLENFHGKSLNRCMHHLLSVVTNPKTVRGDTKVPCSDVKRNSFSAQSFRLYPRRGLQLHEVQTEINWRKRRNSASCSYATNGNYMRTWEGYWVGPDQDDGWGSVEALVTSAG